MFFVTFTESHVLIVAYSILAFSAKLFFQAKILYP
jgi:hypothetical protein